jgi:hypothetical protein
MTSQVEDLQAQSMSSPGRVVDRADWTLPIYLIATVYEFGRLVLCFI